MPKRRTSFARSSTRSRGYSKRPSRGRIGGAFAEGANERVPNLVEGWYRSRPPIPSRPWSQCDTVCSRRLTPFGSCFEQPDSIETGSAAVKQFCQANGQILLPIVNLIQSASRVVETVIHEIGVQTLETILRLSAEQVASPQTPGKASGDIRRHGSQGGHVKLADRKVQVKRPRLRHKTDGEVKISAYDTLRTDRGLSERMLGALLLVYRRRTSVVRRK
jgi:hypothetical protein